MLRRVERVPAGFRRPVEEPARDVEAYGARGDAGFLSQFRECFSDCSPRIRIRQDLDSVKYCSILISCTRALNGTSAQSPAVEAQWRGCGGISHLIRRSGIPGWPRGQRRKQKPAKWYRGIAPFGVKPERSSTTRLVANGAIWDQRVVRQRVPRDASRGQPGRH